MCHAVYYTCLSTFDITGLKCARSLRPATSRYTAARKCLQPMDIEDWRVNGKGNPTHMSKKTRTEWINTEKAKGVYAPAARKHH